MLSARGNAIVTACGFSTVGFVVLSFTCRSISCGIKLDVADLENPRPRSRYQRDGVHTTDTRRWLRTTVPQAPKSANSPYAWSRCVIKIHKAAIFRPSARRRYVCDYLSISEFSTELLIPRSPPLRWMGWELLIADLRFPSRVLLANGMRPTYAGQLCIALCRD